MQVGLLGKWQCTFHATDPARLFSPLAFKMSPHVIFLVVKKGDVNARTRS